MLGHYSTVDTLNLGLVPNHLLARTSTVTPYAYQYQRQDHANVLDYAIGKQNLGSQQLADPAHLRDPEHANIKSYGSVQFLNERNIDNDLHNQPDFGAGIVPEPEELRRKTVGGSALEGLIAEFRNNSLGDDLRKLKEAHKEIIEDLKTAFFQKKPKKRGISKEKGKNPQNQKKAGIERRETLNGQVRKHSPSPPRKAFLSDMNPQTRPAIARNQKNNENHRKPVADNYKSANSSGAYADKTKELYRYNSGSEQMKNHLDIEPVRSEKPRQVKFEDPEQPSPKRHGHTQPALKPQALDGLDERVVEQIMGLREVKISLMKQLNQQTSNYNQVILENKKIQSENIKLREQLGSKQNVENIPYVEQLTQENQKMRDKITKLEHELHKTQQELRNRDKYGPDNIRLEQNLSQAERQIERLNGIMKSPKPGLGIDHKTEMQKLKDQLADVQSKNQRIEQELEHYRSVYGRMGVDHTRVPTNNIHIPVTFNVEHRYQTGATRLNKW